MYICNRCNYETPIKCNFTRHINRKNPCENVNLEINNTVLEEDVIIHTQSNPAKTTPKTAKPTPKSRQKPPKSYDCEYCEKQFTRKDSLNKHIKSRSSRKKENF